MEVHDNRRKRKALTYITDTSRQELHGGLQNGQCQPLQAEITFDVTHGGEVVGFRSLTNGDGSAAPFDAEVTFQDDAGAEMGAQRFDGGALLEWRLVMTSQTATESLGYAGKEGRFDAGGNPVPYTLL
jgi:hypothetical protein